MSDLLTTIARLFVSEPVLLSCLKQSMHSLQVRGALLDALKLKARSQLSGIPEHQLSDAMDQVLPEWQSHSTGLSWAFLHLGQYFFAKDGQGISTRQDHIVEWLEDHGHRLTTLPLMAAILAKALSEGAIVSQRLVEIFRGPLIPLPLDRNLTSFWREGLIETHLHLNGSALPALMWELVLSLDSGWTSTIEGDRQLSRLWRQVLPEFEIMELWRLQQGAKWIRSWLTAWSLGYPLASGVGRTFGDMLQGNRILQPAPPFLLMPHPGRHIPHGQRTSQIVQEGLFWVWILKRLQTRPDELAARMLHAYHLIFSATVQIITHQKDMVGFDLFDISTHSPIRDMSEESITRERLIQLKRTGSLVGLEARVSVKDRPQDTLDNKINPPLNSYEQLRQTSDGNFKLGIIGHFIKKSDDCRIHWWQQTLPSRHASLRNSLFYQAQAILHIKRFFPGIGVRLLAVDGAGNELKAPPEVFAPAFRFLQRSSLDPPFGTFTSLPHGAGQASLRYTFHAGEEFRHLLSGIRAVDEAVRFLDLPAGSRLGHCLALGFDPEIWYERLPEARLSRLEWLDNLVWLYGLRVASPLLQDELASDIERYAKEVYGDVIQTQLTPELLSQAWKLRELGTTPDEHTLTGQSERRRQLRQELPAEAWEIHRVYHYSAQVRRRGNEIIAVRCEKDDAWIEALAKAQRKIMQTLAERELAIESCPVSNLRISQLKALNEHPIFKWRQHTNRDPVFNGVRIAVATDNTGIFMSSLPMEYTALSQTAQQEFQLSGREAATWLREIYEDTKDVTFLDLP
jgi:adenosine deaminase